ncbi:DUF421 domain-containing protein [Clostridium folliculivorans]|uniref:DUF421 domain-containing protein n=1 Tax=Clostridium folliculivorans TaxID=2886038 RepID=A0A9W6D839_9CLOT|nr:DUF421 domain-containing protein [Clostridium folliculivorans]GKU23279.1 DUF421 domain-containing protein [Clostridium folliculivorans]GKU29396.1 DUF421 domain-containing protein [Clostridium folliculivorans]
MEAVLIFKAIVVFIGGTLVLKLGGRKSISQMTIAQTVVMIGMGELIIQPLADKSLVRTFVSAFMLVFSMIFIEYLELKFDFMEKLFSGKSVIVIENGQLNIENMKKLRLTVDRLETRLRQIGVQSIAEVKYATIEVSGQIGYELKDDKKPLTKGEFMDLLGIIPQLKDIVANYKSNEGKANSSDIFSEIKGVTSKQNEDYLK